MTTKVLIIAEAGVNHNGNFDLAIELIDKAKEAGADIVKFQTAIPELVMSKYAEKADYQKKMTGENESQLAMAKRIHLPLSDYVKLKGYCDKKNIAFLSTPFDMPSIETLVALDMPIFKIPSGEITNLPYLQRIGELKKQIIISTGMSKLGEIEDALIVLTSAGAPLDNITVLHCVTEYPTPFNEVNLNAMNTIRSAFGVKVGYSDHTVGIEIPIAAVALGATVIEKHFTLDRNMEGPDHKASLEPHELKAMVQSIRNIEVAMGSGIKVPAAVEVKNMVIARKSIHIQHNLNKGDVLTQTNLIMKRPGDGISPMQLNLILGKKLNKDKLEDTKLTWNDIE
jgi:N,N'-diacetyllegionaminate synthase